MPIQNAILVDDSEDEEIRSIASSHRQSHEYVLSRTPSFRRIPILHHHPQVNQCSVCSAMSILSSMHPRIDRYTMMSTFLRWIRYVRTSCLCSNPCHLIFRVSTAPPIAGSRPQSQPSPAKRSQMKDILLNPDDKDRFWYQSLESEPPSNYTPGSYPCVSSRPTGTHPSLGLIPLLRRALLNSVERGATRRAVLCYEKAVHIYHEIWDAGWCCG